MSQQTDYMPPLVTSELKWSKLWKKFKGGCDVLWHGLVPHGAAQPAPNIFGAANISGDDDFLYLTAQEFYKETIARIDALEEKAFKLLTYISAVSALLVYFLTTNAKGPYKFSIIVALFFLTLAILVSLRCMGVKTQKAIYIDALFDFGSTANSQAIPTTKDKKSIVASMIDCAVFNQNVADNTADILRASRIMLSLGIMATAVSTTFYLSESSKAEADKVSKNIISFSDSVTIRRIEKHLESINQLLLHLPTLPSSEKKSDQKASSQSEVVRESPQLFQVPSNATIPSTKDVKQDARQNKPDEKEAATENKKNF